MKTIIVATDFSKRADNAMLYAVNAASSVGYSLVLFNLFNPSIYALNARVSYAKLDELLERQRTKMLGVCSQIRADTSIKIVPHVATGNFLEELERCIAMHNGDIVVMGMAGKSLDQDLLGNTTTAAIHRLKFPVLAVPDVAAYSGIYKILFAADVLRGLQVNILNKVGEFAKDLGATVEVFHVRESIERLAQADEEKISANLGTLELQMNGINYLYKNILSDEVVGAIRQEIIDSKSELLIMVPQKHGFWESVIHRSKTRVMASGLDIPLLSVPL